MQRESHFFFLNSLPLLMLTCMLTATDSLMTSHRFSLCAKSPLRISMLLNASLRMDKISGSIALSKYCVIFLLLIDVLYMFFHTLWFEIGTLCISCYSSEKYAVFSNCCCVPACVVELEFLSQHQCVPLSPQNRLMMIMMELLIQHHIKISPNHIPV